MISGNKRTKEVKYEVFSTTYWRFSSVTRFCCFRLCTNLTCVVAVWEASYIFLGSVLSQYVVMCVCLCVCNQPFSRNIAPRRTTFYDVARLIMMSPIYCWRNSTHFDVRPASELKFGNFSSHNFLLISLASFIRVDDPVMLSSQKQVSYWKTFSTEEYLNGDGPNQNQGQVMPTNQELSL